MPSFQLSWSLIAPGTLRCAIGRERLHEHAEQQKRAQDSTRMKRCMVRQVSYEPSQDEVFRRSVERWSHQDQDKLRDEDVGRSDTVDRYAAADESGYPDTGRPSEHRAELLPVILEERLIDLDEADDGEQDGEDDRKGLDRIVRVQRPVVVAEDVAGHVGYDGGGTRRRNCNGDSVCANIFRGIKRMLNTQYCCTWVVKNAQLVKGLRLAVASPDPRLWSCTRSDANPREAVRAASGFVISQRRFAVVPPSSCCLITRCLEVDSLQVAD